MLLISSHIFADAPVKPSNPIVLYEFIFQANDVRFPSCHASTIVETKHGLVVAWFAGTNEKNPDVGIWVSRFLNGEWSNPLEVANGVQNSKMRYPTWNPVLFQPKGGPLMLFYKVGPSPRQWWGMLITSENEGKTWSHMEATMLPNPNSGTDAVTLRDGRFILVYNHISPSKTWGSRNKLNMAISEDGINWSAAVLLEKNQDQDSEYSYPAVIQTRDGKIHITYTWNRKLIKHVVVDPSKIFAKDIVKGIWPAK